jgi:site-specific DNA-adenine methylase
MGDKIYALPTREELLAAQSLLQGTTLLNEDFAFTSSFCRADDWVYLDPPYKNIGRFRGEYGYHARFGTDHEDSLVTTVRRLSDLGCLVTISYSYDEQLIDQLTGWHVTPVTAQRSVAGAFSKRVVAQEMIIQNYKKTDNDHAA